MVQGVERKVWKGKCATNLKKQFTNKQKEESEDCDKAEKVRGANSTRTGRKSEAPSSQLQETIECTINPPRYYNTESSRHTFITKK